MTGLRDLPRATWNRLRILLPAFRQYARHLEESLRGCRTVLDIACGSNSPLGYLDLDAELVGIDIHEPSVRASARKRLHDRYEVMDVLDIEAHFGRSSFDGVVALDVIEHLVRDRGLLLLDRMEAVARRSVVVFTPNGFLPQPPEPNNPFQAHVSGWTVQDFRSRGYRVRGEFGRKPGVQAPRFSMRWAWEKALRLSNRSVADRPEEAFALLATRRTPAEPDLVPTAARTVLPAASGV